MKRNLFAILGITSPLLLLFVCAATTIIMAVGGWWLLGQDEESRIIRIIPLAPLTTPQATQVVQPKEQAPVQPAVPPQAEITEPEPVTQPASEKNTALTPEETAKTRGFAIPAGSVDSVNQQGVANRLAIPKLNLNAPIILSPIENQTWKVDHLGQSVGHLEGTAPAGSNSNMVLAAHVTLSKGVYGPFAGLSQLAPGDKIYVYKNEQEFQYIIDDFQTVARTAIEVTYPSDTGQITLITCSNWDDNEGRYIERLIVKGHLAGG